MTVLGGNQLLIGCGHRALRRSVVRRTAQFGVEIRLERGQRLLRRDELLVRCHGCWISRHGVAFNLVRRGTRFHCLPRLGDDFVISGAATCLQICQF